MKVQILGRTCGLFSSKLCTFCATRITLDCFSVKIRLRRDEDLEEIYLK